MRKIMGSITGRNARRQMESDRVNQALDVQGAARDRVANGPPNFRQYAGYVAANARDNHIENEVARTGEQYARVSGARKNPKSNEPRPSRSEVKQAKNEYKVARKVQAGNDEFHEYN